MISAVGMKYYPQLLSSNWAGRDDNSNLTAQLNPVACMQHFCSCCQKWPLPHLQQCCTDDSELIFAATTGRSHTCDWPPAKIAIAMCRGSPGWADTTHRALHAFLHITPCQAFLSMQKVNVTLCIVLLAQMWESALVIQHSLTMLLSSIIG